LDDALATGRDMASRVTKVEPDWEAFHKAVEKNLPPPNPLTDGINGFF
jgi:hypothetical protein